MSGFSILGVTLWKYGAEKEICNSFDRYEKDLNNQKLKLYDKIIEWEAALIRDINEHVNKQISLLRKEYADRVDYLNKKRGEFVEELHVHEETNNSKQIEQLLERCNALNFELAALIYESQDVPFVKVIKGESVVLKQNESDVIETENNIFDNNSTEKHDNQTEDNNRIYSESFSKATSTNTEQTNEQLSRMNSTQDNNRSINSDDYNNSYETRPDNLVEKCPVCFMIFPLNMTAPARSQHVQEHYTDNS